jgi:NTP pyrophosphatase (non-canonical NTP hydrolase)
MTENVLKEVFDERVRQDAKWGIQDHELPMWLAILGEEVGEANKALVESYFGNQDLTELREELIQTAAVAVSIVEFMDRTYG